MNVLYGLYTQTSGKILLNDQEVEFNSPKDAIDFGLGMVHQHFMLLDPFTVTENIILGAEPGKFGTIDYKQAREEVKAMSEKHGLKVDPDATVESLSVGLQQRVEILKTLYRKANILILDEPTSVLTPQETDELFKVIRNLVNKGKTVIFITHKLREVMEISDTVTVLRKGKLTGFKPTSETNENEIARMMVGRDVLLRVDKKAIESEQKPILEIEDLVSTDNRGLVALNQISFEVKPGEILGIAGVQGNGQSELIETITGLRKIERGIIKIKSKKINRFSPKSIRETGI